MNALVNPSTTHYFQVEVPLDVQVCPECSVPHAVPSNYKEWVCPNGHRLGVKQQRATHSKKQNMAKELLLESAQHIGKGKCPYCDKRFERLDRHLAWNHLEEQNRKPPR